MKQLLLLLFMLPAWLTRAQDIPPGYHHVLQQYFQQYKHDPEEPVDGLNFAKKKNGWFVQVVDRLTEEVKNEQLFWSPAGGWQKLNGFNSPLSQPEQEERIIQFLSGSTGMYQFYGYVRSPYYGYSGWDEDMIRDFADMSFTSLADSVLENLGRAYSAYATRFSWYQYGGARKVDDSLKRKLLPLERPSPQRADSIAHYIRKAVACFAALKTRNPAYRTLVGNIGMKHFNEQIFGYDQMLMAGYDEKAKLFLAGIAPDQTIIRLARNYLTTCPSNAILFSFGDIDTYTLWYVQEVLNFRRDVAVINQSLLGLPPYINMLGRKKLVSYTATPETYGDKLFQYSLFKEGENKATKYLSLSPFLQYIYNRKNHGASEPATYPVKEVRLPVDLLKFKTTTITEGLGNSIRFHLGDYVTIDQVMMLDIIQSNIYKRPICFTYDWELCQGHLQRKGMLYQLLPLDAKKSAIVKAKSISQMEAFLLNGFQFIPSTDLSTGVAPDENYDQTNYFLIGQLVEWYHSKGQKEKAQTWLNKLKAAYKNNFPPSTISYLGYLFFLTGDSTKAMQVFEENAALLYQLYQNPSPLYPLFTKESAKLAVSKLQMELGYMKLKSPVIDRIEAALAN